MTKIAEYTSILPPTDDLIFKSLLTRDCEKSKIILNDLISSIIGVQVQDVVVKITNLPKITSMKNKSD